MKTAIQLLVVLSCLLCIITNRSHAQQSTSISSGFVITAKDLQDPHAVENLETLCRVWGYTKYHHPVFCDSLRSIDIDSALFALLPQVVHSDRTARNQKLYKWVHSLGNYTPNRASYEQNLQPYELISSVDLSWTTDTTLLGHDLSYLLQNLRYAERGENRYALSARDIEGIGFQPIVFQGEKNQLNLNEWDSGIQLLSLFRLWNIIEYYGPNKSQTLHPWDEVLTTYIPLMGIETDMRSAQQIHMSLIRELNDGHAISPLCDYYFGQRSLPVSVRYVDGRLFATHKSEDNMLQRGDEILAVDGVLISKRLEDVWKYASRSNDAGYRNAARYYPLRSQLDTAEVVFNRNGYCDTLHMATIPYWEYSILSISEQQQQSPLRMLNDSVGYIYGATFSTSMIEKAQRILEKANTLIVDLRDFPFTTDFALYNLIESQLTSMPVKAWRFSWPTIALPGVFLFNDQWLKSPGSEPEDENPHAWQGQIIVLVDETTRSHTEFLAMALQTRPQTITVGSQTAGTDGDMVLIPLPGGLGTSYSSVGVFYPDGTNAQGVGVHIDVEVYPTVESLRAGRDLILEKALELAL